MADTRRRAGRSGPDGPGGGAADGPARGSGAPASGGADDPPPSRQAAREGSGADAPENAAPDDAGVAAEAEGRPMAARSDRDGARSGAGGAGRSARPDGGAGAAAGGEDTAPPVEDAARQGGAERPPRRRSKLRAEIRELYYGDGPASVRFRYALLAFDVVTVAFFIVTTVAPMQAEMGPGWYKPADLAIGIVLLADFATRLWISTRPVYFLTRWSTLGDIVVLVAVFGSLVVNDLEFLRILRMLRIFRSYHLARELKERFTWYRRNEDIIQSGVNLFVFVFVTTSLVFVVEQENNPDINNYLDALYFTLATLTTTGFGDIVVTGWMGRLLAVVIMILGVALFLRLIQTIFRPTKVQYRCPTCGLNRHDPDAVHCKHCGTVVNIPTKGEL